MSVPENPLLVIFYENSTRSLTVRAIRAGRHRNEFFNFLTPYALILGAFAQIIIALSFLSRPAFRLTMVSSFIALFTPLFPWMPPGILFTIIYRRLWWRARIFRAYRDLARLPLRFIPRGKNEGKLPDGEIYTVKEYLTLPGTFYKNRIPFIIPAGEKQLKDKWYIFGTKSFCEKAGEEAFPGEPLDPFAVYGALPGEPETLARRYNRRAYALEIASWFLLLAGIGLNVFFAIFILTLLF
jgi:hypothetical protein